MVQPSLEPVHPCGPEEWRPIPGFEQKYEVSSHGGVRRIGFCDHDIKRRRKEPRVLKQQIHRQNGYCYLSLSIGNVVTNHRVHKLVAAAFIGPRPDGSEIAHLDADKANNCSENLAYVTRQENYWHSEAHGTRSVGPRHGRSPESRLAKAILEGRP